MIACCLLIAGGAWALAALNAASGNPPVPAATSGPLPSASISSVDGSSSADAYGSVEGTLTGVDIEVPSLVGKSVKVAEALIVGAGLTVQTRVADPPAPGVQPDTVVSQWPAARALVPAGTRVMITYQPRTSSGGAPFIVVVDAGHQLKANLELEPIGPGSKTLKEKVGGGVTGVATGVPEYSQALAVALRLRDILAGRGVSVIMVRTTNGVDIPNSKRAAIGNEANADLTVRVHMNGSTDPVMSGIATLYPSGNKWVGAISTPSLRAAQKVETAVVAASGAISRGVASRADLAGFNYSTVPSILVECGFLSNVAEDRLIATAACQQKLAQGIADGVMAYLEGR